MITIFGTTYFTIGAGLVVLVLAAPFLFWFSRWLLRPNIEARPRHVRGLAVGGTTLALLLLTAVGLFWDVYLIGQRAKELCAETGLVVQKHVPPAGILGLTNIEGYHTIQIPFVESEFQGRRYRYTLHQGQPERREIREFESAYQLKRLSESQSARGDPIEHKFTHHYDTVVVRSSGELLGRLKATAIDAGWFDSLFFGLTGFVYKPWICGKTPQGNVVIGNERMTHRDLVSAIIEPPTNPRTDRNGHQLLLQERLVR